jgi:U3 small nucleolar RNA-associated protein 10
VPLQKSGTPLPSSVLLKALMGPAHSTPSLETLRFIVGLVSPTQRPHRALLGFWTSTLAQLCLRWSGQAAGASAAATRKRSAPGAEDMLPILLPAAVSMATAQGTGAHDSNLGGLMLLCAIGSAFPLAPLAVRTTLDAIFAAPLPPSSARAAVAAAYTLVCGVDEQDSPLALQTPADALISPSTLEALLALPNLEQDLAIAAASYNIRPFLAHMVQALISSGSRPELLASLLTAETTSDDVVRAAVMLLLAGAAADGRALRLQTLAQLRQRRPAIVDDAVRELTGELVSDEQRTATWASMRGVLRLQAGGSTDAKDGDDALWLGVNDAEPGARALALRSLADAVASGELSAKDTFVRDVLRARLADTDVDVLAMLHGPCLALVNSALEPNESIEAALVALKDTQLGHQAAASHVQFVLSLLEQQPALAARFWWEAIWPRVLATKISRKTSDDVLEAIRKADLTKATDTRTRDFALLQAVAAAPTDGEASALNEARARAISKELAATNRKGFGLHLNFLLEQLAANNGAGTLLALLTLEALVPLLDEARFVTAASRALSAVRLAVDDGEDEASQAVYAKPGSARTARKLHAALLVSIARSLPVDNATPLALGSASGVRAIAERIYTIANARSTPPALSRQVLAVLFGRMREYTLPFLAGIWTGEDGPSAGLRFIALRHARAFVSACGPRDFQTLLPAFLLALRSEDASLRLEALECLEAVAKLATDGADVFCLDAVYGVEASKSLLYLETRDVARFATDVVAAREAFRHNSQHVTAWLAEHLSVTRSDGKRDGNYKRALLSCLASHVVSWPSPAARLALLDLLRSVSTTSKVKDLQPLIAALVRQNAGMPDEAYAALLFAAYDRNSRTAIEDASSGAWALMLEALASPAALVQRSAANALKDGLAPVLRGAQLREAFELLAGIASDPSATPVPEVGQALASLPLDAALLVPLLSDLRLAISHGALSSPQAKRSKTSQDGDVAVTRSAAVLTRMLESAVGRPLETSAALLAELFEVLRIAVEMHTSRLIDAELLVQSSMACIAQALERVAKPGLDTESFAASSPEIVQALRSDTVINVVKTSSNPQTFHQALLLLALIATLDPEPVLHNAMPIFTFVGSSVLQRDDALSFAVVERTLRAIVPPLVKSLRRATADASYLQLLQASRAFLCIFTDAATHVPRHRRTFFFRLLVEVLGAADFLAPTAMLLVDRSAHKIVKQAPDEVAATLALPLSLLQPHSAALRLASLNQVWDEALRLWAQRARDPTAAQEHLFLDPLTRMDLEHTGKHPEPARRIRALLAYIVAAIDERDLREALEEESVPAAMEAFVQRALSLANVPDAAIAASARQALGSMMALVPADVFLAVVLELLGDKSTERQRSGLELLAVRLAGLPAEDRAAAAAQTPRVIDAALAALHGPLEKPALSALAAIASSCVAAEQAPLAASIPELLKTGEQAQLVLSPLSRRLGSRLIPHLAALVSFCVEAPSVGAFGTLAGLVSSVPTFMATHLGAIVRLSATPALQAADAQTSEAKAALVELLNACVRRIPALQVFEALAAVWDPQGSKHLHLAVLELLHRVLRAGDRTAIASIYKPVFRFMLRVLDLRRDCTLSAADLAAVEDRCVGAFVRMVLKLNETTFRPLFLRIYDWAALDLAEEDTPVDDAALCARRLVLYKVINGLLDALKGLVANYYATVLDLSVELLEDGRVPAPLHAAVVQSILKSARYDEGTFWSPVRVAKLVPVLLARLAGTARAAHGDAVSTTSALSQTLAALALAVPDERSIKLINGGLLTKARHEDARVKLAALAAVRQLWAQEDLAPTLLGLVPETVPHISELLDADEHAVLDATNGVVTAIEGVLGEPLSAYLQ